MSEQFISPDPERMGDFDPDSLLPLERPQFEEGTLPPDLQAEVDATDEVPDELVADVTDEPAEPAARLSEEGRERLRNAKLMRLDDDAIERILAKTERGARIREQSRDN